MKRRKKLEYIHYFPLTDSAAKCGSKIGNAATRWLDVTCPHCLAIRDDRKVA